MSKTIAHNELSPSDLTQVKRGPKRAITDRQLMYEYIDQSLLCFVGFSLDDQVRVIPTFHWRDGDYLYWHGHSKAANIEGTANGAQQEQRKVCLTIANIDALVMARSAFHHSVNYRSAVIYGVPEKVDDPDEKLYQFKCFIEKVSPGRWKQLRPVNDAEVCATGIMKVSLAEASMKMRDAGVSDDSDDMSWPVWAGIIPLQQLWGEYQQDPQQTSAYRLPELPENV